jgi:hypothetical protein
MPMNSYSLPIVDFLNTFTEHVAMQIAMALPQKTQLYLLLVVGTMIFLSKEYNFTYLKENHNSAC